jgi:hypothetical protein
MLFLLCPVGTGVLQPAQAQTVATQTTLLRVGSESDLPDLQLAASDGSWIGRAPTLEPQPEPKPASAPEAVAPPLPPDPPPPQTATVLMPRAPDTLAALGPEARPSLVPVSATTSQSPRPVEILVPLADATVVPTAPPPSVLQAIAPPSLAALSVAPPRLAAISDAPVTLAALSPSTLAPLTPPVLTGREVVPQTAPIGGPEPDPGTPVTEEPPIEPGTPPNPGLSGEELAIAVQTELQRLNCYRGRIDGDWGKGSKSALARYYKAIESPDVGTEPTQVILVALRKKQDERLCPDPVSAPPNKKEPKKPTNTGPTVNAPPPPPPPPQTPTPPPKKGPTIISF